MMLAKQPSILVTDDDAQFRETLGGILEPLGWRTLLAGDGEEALDIVRREEIHVLLLDNNMPRLTGLETLRLVRHIRQPLPCILLSARLDERLRAEAEEAQAFSVLRKPVSRLDITSAVRSALQLHGWK